MSESPWQPRGRKMVAYHMSESDANDMIAFFKWISNLDLNGFEKVDRKVSPLAIDHMKDNVE
jgi:nitric oxide reductase subunit C